MKTFEVGRSSLIHDLLRYGLLCGVALSCVTSLKGFSLLGPFGLWMTPQVGMARTGDIGGPMNLGEEYRWNVPVITYAFDQSFLDYFGSNGVAAVESAMDLLSGLPPVSQDSPTNYPLRATRANWRAQAEGLWDLKSQVLALMLEQLGLAAPSRYAFCVRSYVMVNGEPQVNVIQRNFDVASWSPSAQVDDTTYGYHLVYGPGNPPGSVDAVEYVLDPFSFPSPAVADGALDAGLLYSGLTQDDAAGLRYLLSTNNMNLEALLPDVHGAGTNADAYVNQAIRGGIDKISFVRCEYDSMIGRFFTPYTNHFIDTYMTNGTLCQQQLERVVDKPDIVFYSADLSNGTWPLPTPRFVRTGTTNWLSFAAPGANGPGIIRPQVQIVLHRPTFLLETADSLTNNTVTLENFEDYRWGSFDVSTNTPIVYPPNSPLPFTNELTVQLKMTFANIAGPVACSWQLPVGLGSQANIQTSTDLINWDTVLPIINHGCPLMWHHKVSQAARYFRVVAQ